jgi:hypothetical protein
MPRDPNQSVQKGGPISKAFAFVVLAALLGLLVLRHLFGSIRVEGGVR